MDSTTLVDISGREAILGNINHSNPPRPGLTFDNGRADDMLAIGLGPSSKYQQRRWVEGEKEYYDDKWGNIWVRMVNGCIKGEIFQPALTD